MRFTYQGKEYSSPDKYLFAEVCYAEDRLRQSAQDFGSGTNQMIGIWAGIRRVDPTLLPWDKLMELSPSDFDILPDTLEPAGPAEIAEEDLPLDPTDAGTPTVPRRVSGPRKPRGKSTDGASTS